LGRSRIRINTLTQARKLFEVVQPTNSYPVLSFYADCVVHTKPERLNWATLSLGDTIGAPMFGNHVEFATFKGQLRLIGRQQNIAHPSPQQILLIGAASQ